MTNPLGNFAKFAKNKKTGGTSPVDSSDNVNEDLSRNDEVVPGPEITHDEVVDDNLDSSFDNVNEDLSLNDEVIPDPEITHDEVVDDILDSQAFDSSDSLSSEIVKRVHESQIDQDSVILMVDQCSPDGSQPRKSFEDVKERAESIEAHGLLQAIVVRPDPENPNRFIIVSGETRWRAFKEILMLKDPVKYSTIPARIRNFSDDAEKSGDVLLIQLIENLQRTDLSPLEEAEGLQRLKDAKKINNKQLAALIKKSESRVSRILKLLTLSEEQKAQVEKGEISARDIQRGKGTEAAERPKLKKEDTQKPREAKLSISMETAKTLSELLKILSEQNNLSDIDLGNMNKKDLTAILESRAAEVLGAIK